MFKSIKYMLLFALCLCPMTALAIPDIQRSTLKNGMQIMLMEAHQVPIVSMQLVFPAGSRMDNKHGTSALLAQMLTDHTAKHARESWLNLIDAHALRLSAHVSEDALYIQLRFLREDLQVAMQSLQELLVHPGWQQARFKLLKKNTLAALEKAQEQASVLAAWEAKKQLYGTHPYAHPSSGTPKTVAQIQMQDLQTLFQQQIQPEGAILAVSGDLDIASLQDALATLTQVWQGKVQVSMLDVPTVQTRQPFTTYIEMAQQQTTIVMTRLSLAKHDPDYFPTFILNYILGGGGFASKLMQEVREERGLAYGVYSFFTNPAAQGRFEIHLKTRHTQAELAKKTVLDVLNTLYQKVTAEELKAAKANLIGSFAQRLDSNRERAANIANVGLYQLPNDYLQSWTHQMNSVTLAQVQRVAKRFLAPKSWSLIQVGSVEGEKND